MPNRVNLLLNSDFSRTVAYTENPDSDRLFPADWTKGAGITTAIENCVRPNGHGMPDCLTGNALRMQSGKTASDVAFHQVVDVSGGEGDVFAAGGWCKSNSVLSGAPTSAPTICYRLYHNGWRD